MKLKSLSVKDKPLVKEFISLARRELSVYTFDNIYLWKALYDILWGVHEGTLCVFFKDKLGCFMYLPPLGKSISSKAVRDSFAYMDTGNIPVRGVSRIENIEEQDTPFFIDAGYAVSEKFPEYLCDRQEIAGLRGNKFKSQRSSFNYFVKNYRFSWEPFSLKEKGACANLYKKWMRARKKYDSDPVYRGMARDSCTCLDFLFDNWKQFDFTGRVVKVEGVLKGFTLGFEVNKDMFCISHEITDLTIKGLGQFIFSSFSRDLEGYHYVNIMDDSGLENLKATKLLYHPRRLIKSFIAEKKK